MPAEHTRQRHDGAGPAGSGRVSEKRFHNDTLLRDSARAPSRQKYMAVSKSGLVQARR